MSDDFDDMDDEDENSSNESLDFMLNNSGISSVRRRIHNDDIRMQPALLAASKINVHVLYTLSFFLIGKERKREEKSTKNFNKIKISLSTSIFIRIFILE